MSRPGRTREIPGILRRRKSFFIPGVPQFHSFVKKKNDPTLEYTRHQMWNGLLDTIFAYVLGTPCILITYNF